MRLGGMEGKSKSPLLGMHNVVVMENIFYGRNMKYLRCFDLKVRGWRKEGRRNAGGGRRKVLGGSGTSWLSGWWLVEEGRIWEGVGPSCRLVPRVTLFCLTGCTARLSLASSFVSWVAWVLWVMWVVTHNVMVGQTRSAYGAAGGGSASNKGREVRYVGYSVQGQ